jgi:hypothetical protein
MAAMAALVDVVLKEVTEELAATPVRPLQRAQPMALAMVSPVRLAQAEPVAMPAMGAMPAMSPPEVLAETRRRTR